MSKLLIAFLLFSSGFLAMADETDKYCIVCGKGPLEGLCYSNRWGFICEECYNATTNRCANCGLPIRDGTGVVQLGDGRLICKFCRSNAVLDVGEAADIFSTVRQQMLELYGNEFALKYTNVDVELFDEKLKLLQASEGKELMGYALSSRVSNGTWIHQVLLMIGACRTDITKMSAHEYTHLWISENKPEKHVIDHDTAEAICELSAYKLMESQNQPDALQEILNNRYTHGKIKRLVEIEQEKGVPYVLNWVKNSLAPDFDSPEPVPVASAASPAKVQAAVPKALPVELKYTGQMDLGQYHAALINGVSLAPGDVKTIRLRDRTVRVRCESIVANEVRLKLDGKPEVVTLKLTKTN